MALGEDKRIINRAEYMRATGYDVKLLVTYERVRKVRALDEEQAREFAEKREAEYANRYFNATTHIGYEIINVEVTDVTPSVERTKKQAAKKRSGKSGS